IIAISECYDALRTDRPYRKALSNQEALEIMNKETAQGKWDPKLIGEFQELLMDPDIQEKLNRNISEINNLN
ncbi:MAG: hypothetical protein P8Y99_13720, partial [Calditrichaceae bacterium]